MPRRSPYKILLEDKEERQLEALAPKYTSPYCDVMRAKVVLLAAQGFSNKEIGRRLQLPRLGGLQERPRRGRPRGFPP
jgi:hypothetical protein